MGLFGGLFGGGDPSSQWVRDPSLRLEADLEAATLCGVRLGSRPASLSGLGPPANATPAKDGVYPWPDLGVEAFAARGLLVAYSFAFDVTAPFAGPFLRGGKPIPLAVGMTGEDVLRLLGEPWHRYADPDFPDSPLQLFYETRTLEWELGVLPSGVLGSLVLRSPPALADPAARQRHRVEKRWPPA